MTEEQRKDGGVTVHILISLYIFAILAVVCDDYFVASLEKICEGKSSKFSVPVIKWVLSVNLGKLLLTKEKPGGLYYIILYYIILYAY